MANIRRTNFWPRERWQCCSVFPPPASWRDNQQKSGPSGRHTWLRCKVRSVGIGSHAFPYAGSNFELSGLVSGGGHPCISQQLVWGVKPGEVADFCQDHGSHAEPQPRDSGNRRMKLIHNGLDLLFDFINFTIQFTDEPDGVLQFKGLGRHLRANRVLAAFRISRAISRL